MMKALYILVALGTLAATLASTQESHAAPLEHRWVYLATNLLVDKNVEDALVLLDRAAKAGYNGVVLTDGKFLRWDQLPERYVQNVRRVRQACRDHRLACIACVCPIGYFLQHDEIRVQGWDESCRKTGKTPGELLAENVSKCVELVRTEDAGKPIYVWSDMFDPSHNAQKAGRYYLVKGDGPWYGSWKGLDKDVVIVNWNSAPGKRTGSLRHFAGLGHRQILAGYYDRPVGAIRDWLRDGEQVPGIVGAMYTTWQHQYRDLEVFAVQLEQH